ncbi:type I DNA topoisomerase [Pseudodesulfovibrio senegalensis]|uniref:DNA topoisomerase 1 n=1 Tax=Pseudodesulfovibrio senegalensis TaxID=1721087 RepID=A0A6N6N1Z7_9BACT|nr:type I DNA topoisomerase [Pseudodesulfovibrio senegalensis]KAB1439119.1 type I DNA topoisomerase [Pseudodesulfovibrio senegalensis]
MAKDLIIVESPAKVKTISKFLGKDYLVEASVGHVRDLPTRDLGVDEENGFEPHYEIIQGKEDVVKKLRQAAKKADHVFLAPDPDREGEAIAWHVAEVISKQNKSVSRIQFNEITARAVKEALEHPQELNRSLFDSQQARRILDRLVGYKISPILWKNVKRGISAGRVQSVALKIIVEREKERRAFDPKEYWPFKAQLAGENPPPFWLDLWKYKEKSVKPGGHHVTSADEAQALEKALNESDFVVDAVEEKQRSRQPRPPYITSTMQQEANQRLGYSARKTMTVAQRLYEGVELGKRGTTALITYMRTDSVRVAKDAQEAAKELILEKFGKDHYPSKTRNFRTKGSAQDAHEAIRPVDVSITPEEIKKHLPSEQYRLYKLIWQRFVASQMAAAKFWDTTVTVSSAMTMWRAKGERLLFPGFLAAMDRHGNDDTADLPKLTVGEKLAVKELKKEQKFTQPPARYSEASLVRTLEEMGIGRPSTYAAIISTLIDREYTRLEEKRFVPTELGFTVSDQLSAHFPDLMDVGFTASMENSLDEVAEGNQEWSGLLNEFAGDFYPTLDKARKDMATTVQDTGVTCSECGKPMVIKFGRTGEFLGCTGFPSCRNIKNFKRDEKGNIVVVEREEPEQIGIDCDKCGRPMAIKQSRRGEFLGCTGYPDCRNIKNFERDEDGNIKVVEQAAPEVVGTCPECGGELHLKKARTGSRFIACANYPDCTYTEPYSTGVSCPNEGCDGMLVEKASRKGKIFYSCSNYPKCDYAVWDWPVKGPCPDCGHPVLVRKNTRAKGEHIACPKRGCKYEQKL